MKKLIALSLLWLMFGNVALCKQTQTKYNIYNSKGQRTGYAKVYSSGEKVVKIEKFNNNSKRIERIKKSN